MKNIAVLVPNSYQIDLRILRETESLGRNGYVSHVFCPTQALPGLRRPIPGNVIMADTVPELTYLISRPSELRKYFDLARAVSRQSASFSAIYSHDLSVSTVGCYLANKLGIPIVCDFHELFIKYLAGDENRALKRKALQLFDLAWSAIGGKVARSADGFITVNDSLAEIYNKQWRLCRKPTVLHNYSSKKHASQKQLDKSYFHERFRIAASKKILLFQGKLFKDKGVDIIYQAFKEQKDFAIIFLGYGALVKRVIEYQNSHPGIFYYHEAVPADDLVSYTACADLGLAPIGNAKGNHYYSSPNKVYEYLAAGIPFVCSDLPEMRRIATDTSAGVTVPVNDAAGLCQAATDIFLDNKHMRMAEAAREAFNTRYCWEAEEEKLLSLFAQVV